MKLLNASAVGNIFSGKTAKTGARFMGDKCPIPVYVVGGKRYVKENELLEWIELQKVEPRIQQPTDLRSMLQAISDRVLEQKRKAGAA